MERIITTEILVEPYLNLTLLCKPNHVGIDIEGADRIIQEAITFKRLLQNIQRLIKGQLRTLRQSMSKPFSNHPKIIFGEKS